MRDAFVRKLTELASSDDSIFFITADLGFGVFDEYATRFPNQYLNVGVAEQNMTGIGTGLCLEGRKVFTYSIANFATLRCLEQIRNDAAYHDVNLTVVASGGGFSYGALGVSHHATEDLAIMRALPNVSVVAPCSAWEAYHATGALTENTGVGYLRLEKGGIQEAPFEDCKFQLGKAIEYKDGEHVAIITTGGIIEECLEAAHKLDSFGISTRVISMHSVKPIDEEVVLQAARECGSIVTVEEHNRFGGLTGAVAEVIAKSGFNCKFDGVTLDDIYSSEVGDQKYLRSRYGLDANGIVQKVSAL